MATICLGKNLRICSNRLTQTTAESYVSTSLSKLYTKSTRGRKELENIWTTQVSTVVFREDFTNAAVFRQLDAKITQELVTGRLVQQIREEFRYLTQLNDCLATLDIAIGFLVTVGGSPDLLLKEFLSKELRMDPATLGQTCQRCFLKHAQSLWLLLSHQRAKILASGDQDAFDQIDEKYKEDIPEDSKGQLTNYLQHQPHLCNLLDSLYECILLHLATPQNQQDPDYIENKDYPLGHTLAEFISDKNYSEIPGLAELLPADVCVKHSIATWRLALTMATNTGRL